MLSSIESGDSMFGFKSSSLSSARLGSGTIGFVCFCARDLEGTRRRCFSDCFVAFPRRASFSCFFCCFFVVGPSPPILASSSNTAPDSLKSLLMLSRNSASFACLRVMMSPLSCPASSSSISESLSLKPPV
eukprot:30819-Pelagococcus_subviridis.AAC.8